MGNLSRNRAHLEPHVCRKYEVSEESVEYLYSDPKQYQIAPHPPLPVYFSFMLIQNHFSSLFCI